MAQGRRNEERGLLQYPAVALPPQFGSLAYVVAQLAAAVECSVSFFFSSSARLLSVSWINISQL